MSKLSNISEGIAILSLCAATALGTNYFVEKSVRSLMPNQKSNNYLEALIQIESGGNPNASNYEPHIKDTSYGLCQILTSTARRLERKHPELPRLGEEIEKSLCDSEINKKYATTFVDDLKKLYGDNPELIAAAYNLGSRGPLNARVQEQLNDLNYPKLKCDGSIGKNTKRILRMFQRENGLEVDGILGPKTYQKIQTLWTKQYPNQLNPKGIIPDNENVKDYSERFVNLLETF